MERRGRLFFLYWLPPLVWMALIFALSAQPKLPSVPGPWLDTLLKKTGHALGYAVLAWLYARALRPHFSDVTALRLVSIGLAALYALSDEFHQTFVPGRNGTLVDVAIDASGIIGAMLLYGRLACRRHLPAWLSGAR
jgi:VanZ family protein